MKKLLVVLTISLSLLTTSVYATTQQTPSNTNNSIILYVQSSNLDQHLNLYITSALDENGEQYVIKSYDNISGHWLEAEINQDYEIINYTIMEDK